VCQAHWQQRGPSVVNSGSLVSSPSLSVDQDQEQYAARNEEPPGEVSADQLGFKSVHPSVDKTQAVRRRVKRRVSSCLLLAAHRLD
jgi:hypothetical protein